MDENDSYDKVKIHTYCASSSSLILLLKSVLFVFQVVQWLNDAQLAPDNEKLQSLQKTIEVVVNKEPQLLKDFIDHIIAFQADRNAEVRKHILTFYELAGY